MQVQPPAVHGGRGNLGGRLTRTERPVIIPPDGADRIGDGMWHADARAIVRLTDGAT